MLPLDRTRQPEPRPLPPEPRPRPPEPRPHAMVPTEIVPKPGGGTRRLARLDEADHRAYTQAVGSVLARVEASLLPGVTANRARATERDIELEPWKRARSRYRARLREALTRPGVTVFVGDVRACYASILPSQVERALRQVGSRPADLARIGNLLRDLSDRGPGGLPIGPSPSAPLANVVLSHLDRAIDVHAVGWARWVDDVVVVTDGPLAASRVHDVFHRELADVGLEANPAKTMILPDPREATRQLPGPRARSRLAGP